MDLALVTRQMVHGAKVFCLFINAQPLLGHTQTMQGLRSSLPHHPPNPPKQAPGACERLFSCASSRGQSEPSTPPLLGLPVITGLQQDWGTNSVDIWHKKNLAYWTQLGIWKEGMKNFNKRQREFSLCYTWNVITSPN